MVTMGRMFRPLNYLIPLTTLMVLTNALSLPNWIENRKDGMDNDQRSTGSILLYSPLPGQILRPGETFLVSTENGISRATSKNQVVLVNRTGSYVLSKDLMSSSGPTGSKVVLPQSISDGVYGFIYSERSNNHGVNFRGPQVTIHVEQRPDKMELNSIIMRRSVGSSYGRSPENSRLEKRAPHLPVFKYPLQNQSIAAGETFRVSFTDGELNTQQAQFVLREKGAAAGASDKILTGPSSSESAFTFQEYSIMTDLIVPSSTSSGFHTLVAQELYPNSPENKVLDVATVDVSITPNIPLEGELPKKIKRQTFAGIQLEKRAPHPPVFNSPKSNQSFFTGHHINVSFVDGELTTDKARFVLRSKNNNKSLEDLILYGRNSSKSGFFTFQQYNIRAYLFIPKLVPTGSYDLIAQETYNSSTNKVLDVKAVTIHVERRQNYTSSTGGGSEENLRHSLTLTERKAEQEFLSTHRSKSLPHPVRLSPAILEPFSGQDVPVGSQFEIKIEDPQATTEIAQFVLRYPNGSQYYLGSSKFKKGIATLKVHCPKQLKYDSYELIAQVNSLTRPQTFLNANSVTVLVTHSQTFETRSTGKKNKLMKRANSLATLISPGYNAIITPGESFECSLRDGASKASDVQYCIRFDDGRADLVVGKATMKNGLGKSSCVIPSDVIPGTYMFVGKESTAPNSNKYKDARSILITVAKSRSSKRSRQLS